MDLIKNQTALKVLYVAKALNSTKGLINFLFNCCGEAAY